MESNRPMIRRGMRKDEPREISRRSHVLLKMKTEAITNMSSQKI
jgi:hypothetical protein